MPDDMTWDQIKEFIDTLPPERRKDTATVHLTKCNEMFPIYGVYYNNAKEDDRLDHGHMVITVDH